MKKIFVLILLLLINTYAYASLTVGNIPKTKTGGTTPSLENSAITELSGNVGVNSTNPGQKLDVVGVVRATSFSGNGSALTGIGPTVAGSDTQVQFNDASAQAGNAGFIFQKSTGTVTATHFVGDGSGITGIGGSISGLTTNQVVRASSSTTIADGTITDNGNVGVGSTNPSQKLDIIGTVSAVKFLGSGTASKSPFTLTVASPTSLGGSAADYTATGTADQTIINTALTRAALTGGEVKLLEGTFNINGTILVPSSTVLDMGNATIVLANASNVPMITNASFPAADSNIIIRGGHLSGNGAGQGTVTVDATHCYAGIWLKNVSYASISGVGIVEAANYAIRIELSNNVRVNNINVLSTGTHLNQDGVDTIDSNNVAVSNLTTDTEDDSFAIATYATNTYNISYSNVTAKGSHGRATFVNDFWSGGTGNLLLSDINVNNVNFRPGSGYALFRFYNQSNSGANMKRINISNLTGTTSGLNAGELGIFTSTNLSVQQINMNNIHVIDDGNGIIWSGITGSGFNLSNMSILNVKSGFTFTSSAEQINMNNIYITGASKPASATTSYGILAPSNATHLGIEINGLYAANFGTGADIELLGSINGAYFYNNRLGFNHTDTTYNVTTSNITYDSNNTDYVNSGVSNILLNGNVGIGTALPTKLFCVGATCQGSIDSSGNVIGIGFTSSGNVGVSTTAPTTCGCKQYTNGLCTTVGTCS